jgi:hypothetical protein
LLLFVSCQKTIFDNPNKEKILTQSYTKSFVIKNIDSG